MYPFDRINTYRDKARDPGTLWRRRFSAALPWIFILGVAAATMLPLRQWVHWPASTTATLSPHEIQAARDAETIWKSAGNSGVRHPVDVLRTIDGDTFEARVHLSPGLEPTTRVRLRGVDAPELKAACAQEMQMAEAAGSALRGLLGEGGVTIYNIGPDKYNGRVVADVATRRTDNVSAALLAAGHARGYVRGRRGAWC
ncbi:MAG: thermonuclease family protein [Bradyrhizobium sp.]|uniref:thermonuclease family protein n=1 Tax=Bradyrhizobium sp. TaxID=376 RepID=UPI00271EEF8F|nr:thermonuclease family protein [Bradyrhizobium sp.]MDO8401417.1 thermonuclease family protein [Bradyrhizobium sp.]